MAADRFVGRQREVKALQAALEAACAGHGQLALIAGDAGIGKTRIAVEFVGSATTRGTRVLWGRCYEEEGAPPYWPWTQLLEAMAITQTTEQLRADLGPGASDIGEIVPEIRVRLMDLDPTSTSDEPSEARFRLFGSIARYLTNVSRRHPIALVLDDIHWANAPSLRLMEFVAQEIAESRVLLIASYRGTGLSRHHPLLDSLGTLIRLPHAVRLQLSGLGLEAVRQFIMTVAGTEPPEWLIRAIHRQTEGNPLFVREIVRLLLSQGYLAAGAHIPASIGLPAGIREAIVRRLKRLSSICNEVLAAASVIGRTFSFAILVQACTDHTEDIVQQALDEALAAHIIEEAQPETYLFTHTLVRVTLYDELPIGQRRRLHHAVGEAIEAAHQGDPDPVLADLAHHFRLAGLRCDAQRAISYTLSAARRADLALAFEDAAAFCRNGLQMLDALGAEEPDRRCALMLLLGEVLCKTNDYADAVETLRRGADVARSHQLVKRFAELAIALTYTEFRRHMVLSPRYWSLQADPILQEAYDALPETEAGLRIRIIGLFTRIWTHIGYGDEAKQYALRLVAMARTLGDPGVLTSSLSSLSSFPALPDETLDRLADATEMTEVAARAGNSDMVASSYAWRTTLCLELGDIAGAAAAVDRIGSSSILNPVRLTGMATLALLQGDLEGAERTIVQAIRARTAEQSADPVAMLTFALRREQGRLQELAPLLASMVRETDTTKLWQPGLALLHLELGDRAAARAVFDQLATNDFAAVSHDVHWLTSMAFLAEVCAALGDRSGAAMLYPLLLPWADRNVVMGGGAGCLGSTHQFLGLLAYSLGRWRDAERHFEAALTMNERTGARVPLGYTLCDYAVMLGVRHRPGDHAAARAHLDRATGIARACTLVALSARVAEIQAKLGGTDDSAAPDDLTTRELEVLRLIAMGRSNADIALVLEIRFNTVATHVRNILAKTGCASRGEAAAYAVYHGLTTERPHKTSTWPHRMTSG